VHSESSPTYSPTSPAPKEPIDDKETEDPEDYCPALPPLPTSPNYKTVTRDDKYATESEDEFQPTSPNYCPVTDDDKYATESEDEFQPTSPIYCIVTGDAFHSCARPPITRTSSVPLSPECYPVRRVFNFSSVVDASKAEEVKRVQVPDELEYAQSRDDDGDDDDDDNEVDDTERAAVHSDLLWDAHWMDNDRIASERDLLSDSPPINASDLLHHRNGIENSKLLDVDQVDIATSMMEKVHINSHSVTFKLRTMSHEITSKFSALHLLIQTNANASAVNIPTLRVTRSSSRRVTRQSKRKCVNNNASGTVKRNRYVY
jgi:hypothetical protein